MWWLLCKIDGIVWRYDLTASHHAALLKRYDDENLSLAFEEHYDEYLLRLAHVTDLRRLFRGYQQVVGRIPVRIADEMRDVHYCEMVFQVLLDYPEENVMADFIAGRPLFF